MRCCCPIINRRQHRTLESIHYSNVRAILFKFFLSRIIALGRRKDTPAVSCLKNHFIYSQLLGGAKENTEISPTQTTITTDKGGKEKEKVDINTQMIIMLRPPPYPP